MSLQLPRLPITITITTTSSSSKTLITNPFFRSYKPTTTTFHHRQKKPILLVSSSKQENNISVAAATDAAKEETLDEGSPEDLEYVRQIQNVLEMLKKNRDMLYNEVKLTVMIEDPREIERMRLLGIEDPDTPSRDDLVAALDDVKEGRIPENRIALKVLAEEMLNWPNLEVEVKRTKQRKSLYAKATDTGVDPQVAAKRLKIDWDSAAEIEDSDVRDQMEVPSLVGFGVLYLVSALPIIIGVSVVLILFYNSLQ